ncbi:MAG: NIPSNAP family protein [Candidatus Dormibacteraeota bacterium]|nr:NIPSNAP family protein [Candidatus Dormibacteraeota bacterium]
MVYEYRRYEVMPGRLPDLLRRFQSFTLPIWARFGIEHAGFWLADVGTSNQLHYLLRWKDLADREAKWAAFQADPEWLQRRAETEADGPLVARVHNELWRPTAFSEVR